MSRAFVSGVVEGFYGRPWSETQRVELFQRLEYLGLNTYLYAPKDDMKHRQMWRDLYSKEETIQLKYLIDASKRHNITFVYAISPGLDITFSNVTDTFLLKYKMQQVLELGCDAFAILFDDIPPNLRDIDKSCFHSVANAQATLTNDIYDYLKKPKFFLFCPTEYCASRSTPCVIKSEYLSTIGTTLKPEIDIMWTGPKVIAKFITFDSIVELGDVLKRRPIIWDNIHANDYDQKRLFLGPYCGRSSKLIPYIRGVLTNPNCEFEANFIAIHTLAQWVKSNGNSGGENMVYIPSVALRLAITDWLDVMYQNKDQIRDNKSLLSFVSGNDCLSPNPVTLNHNNTDELTYKASELFISPTVACKSQSIQEIINVTSTSLTLNDQNEDNVSSLSRSTPLLIVEEPKNLKVNNNIESITHDKEEKMVKSVEKNSELISNQNNMETMDINLNLFPLTPMETEDNSVDTENVQETMAMQVDSAEDGPCEIMDVIDETNDSKVFKELEKQSASLHSEESEMEDTVSNESVELTDATICTSVSKLTVDDLNLLVHFFFLPYEHGPLAIKILELIYWIRSNSHLVDDKPQCGKKDYVVTKTRNSDSINNVVNDGEDQDSVVKCLEWHMKAKEFESQVERVRNLVDRMSNIPNRNVLFDLYPYIQDLRHVLGTLSSYVKCIGCTSEYKNSFLNDDHEPWMFRGGLISELQRMCPLEGTNDLFPNQTSFFQYRLRYGHSSYDVDVDDTTDSLVRRFSNADVHISNNVNVESIPMPPVIFMMRPYISSDKRDLYSVCLELFLDQLLKNNRIDPNQLSELNSSSFKDLVGDRYIGYFIEFSPQQCILIENEHGDLLGYALGCQRVEDILNFRRDIYAEKMKIKYESKIGSVSDGDLPLSNTDTIIKSLVDGFFDETLYNRYLEMKDKPHALIHLVLTNSGKETDVDTIDTITRRLLTCFSSLLKMKSNQIICCEVDSLNKSYEDFYRRYGFIKCNNIDDTFSLVSIMSRYV